MFKIIFPTYFYKKKKDLQIYNRHRVVYDFSKYLIFYKIYFKHKSFIISTNKVISKHIVNNN